MEQAAKSSRKTKVLTLVQEATQELLDSGSDRVSGIHAGLIAEKLQMGPANVARELNSLYRNGQLIKIQENPPCICVVPFWPANTQMCSFLPHWPRTDI